MTISKKKLAAFGAGVLSLAIVAGSWAFYSSEAAIDNELKTNKYGDKTVEEFTPKQEIEPGSEITKEVGVTNTGDYDLVVRIKMDETWTRGEDEIIAISSSDASFNTVDPDSYEAIQGGASSDQAVTAKDGLVPASGATKDESVMYKNLDLTNWIDGGDGYWYYKDKLTPGANTGELLKSLTFATNADMGRYDNSGTMYSTVAKDNANLAAKKTAYETALAAYEADNTNAAKKEALETAISELDAAYGWTSTKPADESTITFIKSENDLASEAKGYAEADYTLTVTTEVCQATADAVEATWTTGTVPAALTAKLS